MEPLSAKFGLKSLVGPGRNRRVKGLGPPGPFRLFLVPPRLLDYEPGSPQGVERHKPLSGSNGQETTCVRGKISTLPALRSRSTPDGDDQTRTFPTGFCLLKKTQVCPLFLSLSLPSSLRSPSRLDGSRSLLVRLPTL